MNENEKRDYAKDLLRAKYNELKRVPQKDDFADAEKSRIKAFLGTWPRALEAAGLKKPKPILHNNYKKVAQSKQKQLNKVKKINKEGKNNEE